MKIRSLSALLPLIAAAVFAPAAHAKGGGSPEIGACPATFKSIRTATSFACSCTAQATQEGQVIGGKDGVYSPDSAVCRAGLQMNRVAPEGGVINNIQDVRQPVSAFEGTEGFHGVRSIGGPGAKVHYRISF